MVGQINKKEEIKRALKAYIMRDREKQRLEDEAEAEKTRKKKELDEKKSKEESEFKATKDKLAEVTKKHEQLQQDKIKVFEHLKKVVGESNKHGLAVEDLTRLCEIGLAVTTCVSTPSHPPVHPAGSTSVTVLPRHSNVTSTNQYKTAVSSSIPVQTIPHQKRNRSPSPPIYRANYYKQAAGPHAFQKLEDPHRNREYKSYLFKPNNNPQPGQYSAFYSPAQNAVYTMPSPAMHSNTPTYSNYGSSRDNVEVLHKSQQQNISSIPPPPSPSLYASHRSSIQSSTPSSVQSNHVYHSKSSQGYSEDKYYMVRPASHGPVHPNVIPIHQAPQSSKHGSITSGYPVRPVAGQMGSQSQLHMPQHGSSHHGSQSSHHSSQPPVHSSSLSSHHSSQSHHVSSQQSQNMGHQSHHQSQSVHYPPSHHPQSHQAHHPSSQSSSSHHQLIQHHGSPSIHHTSSQQHIQQIHQQQQHHPPHSQAMHHSQIQQPHIQQHISPHSQQSQQSQPTSVVTSQAYANQMSAIQGGGRVMYSQSNMPH